jgi:hypothetical protein
MGRKLEVAALSEYTHRNPRPSRIDARRRGADVRHHWPGAIPGFNPPPIAEAEKHIRK